MLETMRPAKVAELLDELGFDYAAAVRGIHELATDGKGGDAVKLAALNRLVEIFLAVCATHPAVAKSDDAAEDDVGSDAKDTPFIQYMRKAGRLPAAVT